MQEMKQSSSLRMFMSTTEMLPEEDLDAGVVELCTFTSDLHMWQINKMNKITLSPQFFVIHVSDEGQKLTFSDELTTF